MKNLALIIKIRTKIEDEKHLFFANSSELLNVLRVQIECFWSVDYSNNIKHFRIFWMVFFSKLFNKRLVLIWDKHVLCETRCLLNNYHIVYLCHFHVKNGEKICEIDMWWEQKIQISLNLIRKEFPYHRDKERISFSPGDIFSKNRLKVGNFPYPGDKISFHYF